MDIRIIVFGMMVVLAFLFIGAKIFVPREKEQSKREAFFVEAIKLFKENPSKEHYIMCINAAKELKQYQSKSTDEISESLSKQGITFS